MQLRPIKSVLSLATESPLQLMKNDFHLKSSFHY